MQVLAKMLTHLFNGEEEGGYWWEVKVHDGAYDNGVSSHLVHGHEENEESISQPPQREVE